MSNRLVAVVNLAPGADLKDADALLTMIGERWHYEPELDLSEGSIRVWRTDEPKEGDEDGDQR